MENRVLADELVEEFALHLVNEERSAATMEKYRRDITSFRRFAAGREIAKDVVVAYKQHLIESGYAERSINSMLAAVNSLFAFLGWFDCRVKPIRLSPEIYRAEERELTLAEYRRPVETAVRTGKEKIAVVLQTVCGTGIRVSELKYITVEAVKRGEAKVRCKGKTRTVFIVSSLRSLLADCIKKRHIKTGPVFLSSNGKPINRTTVWRDMKNLCAQAEVSPSKVFPHNLRHLFSRVFYKNEKDVSKLADILGHSSVDTTRIYLISTGKEHRRSLERMGLVVPMRI